MGHFQSLDLDLNLDLLFSSLTSTILFPIFPQFSTATFTHINHFEELL